MSAINPLYKGPMTVPVEIEVEEFDCISEFS